MGGVLQARGMEAVPRQTHAGADGVLKYEKVLYVVCVSALAPHVRLI